jgi:hypothetical protein
MASGFPGSIDSFTNPLTTSPLNSPSHAGQHQDLNDAVNKIETYMGLVKVIPTSISSAGGTAATLAANGTVNVGTSNTSITVNGAFSSRWDNYMILFSGGTCAGAGAFFELQLNNSTGTTYSHTGLYTGYGSTTVTGYNPAATTRFICGSGDTASYSGQITLYGPNLARRTLMTMSSIVTYQYLFSGIDTSTAQSTGFTFFPSSAVTGGTIRVYGFAN